MDTENLVCRRALLKGSLTAVLAAAVTVPAMGAPDKGESREFMAALEVHGEALWKFDHATAVKDAAVARFEEIAPTVPRCLRAPNTMVTDNGCYSPFGVAERLLDGERNEVREAGRPVFVAATHQLERLVRGTDGRTAVGRQARRMLEVARAFEAEFEAARIAAGLPDAMEAHFYADEDLVRAAMALVETPAHTVQGALLKVRAWVATGARRKESRHHVWAANQVLENIASVLANDKLAHSDRHMIKHAPKAAAKVDPEPGQKARHAPRIITERMGGLVA